MCSIPRMTAEEAAAMIKHGDTVAFSGFTPAGSPKIISRAIAAHAETEHAAGRDYKIGVISGASTDPGVDGALARANAVSFRTPYQSDKDMRTAINAGCIRFFDMHLSMVAQNVRYGFLGPIHHAIIEACDVTDEGEIVLTSGVGCAPTFIHQADRIFIELNKAHSKKLRGFHDIYEPADPPHRKEIPVYTSRDRVGSDVVAVDPYRIVGIIETDQADAGPTFRDIDETTQKIGDNVANFLVGEMKAGRIPDSFLPIQSGVGETANAVLCALGNHPDIPAFDMYTEVIQDAVLKLMKEGKISFASGSSLTFSADTMKEFYDDIEFYREKIILRPQEITNNPEVARRLGIISCNTALEADVFGNINSTHVLGSKMMNGIGGSGDFTRNAYISMFICPSTQKGGKISTIVPQVSHVDHTEHSVQVIATEWGVADLRGKAPNERARLIIERCAHPTFRGELLNNLAEGGISHTPQDLQTAYEFHESFRKTGNMHS